MKNIKKIVAVMLAAMMMLALVGCNKKAADDNKLVVATSADFPPYEYVEGGEFVGIDMDIARAIADKLGMELEIQNVDFDSVIAGVTTGKYQMGMSGITANDERRKNVNFTDSYATTNQVIIVKEGSDIKSAADLADKFTAVVQGYTGETCITELGYKYESFKKGTECILELVNGKCDAVVIDSATASKYVADNEGLVIVTDDEAFGSEQYAIAVKKGNTELLEKINATIQKMLDDGTIGNLSDKYCTAEE